MKSGFSDYGQSCDQDLCLEQQSHTLLIWAREESGVCVIGKVIQSVVYLELNKIWVRNQTPGEYKNIRSSKTNMASIKESPGRNKAVVTMSSSDIQEFSAESRQRMQTEQLAGVILNCPDLEAESHCQEGRVARRLLRYERHNRLQC